MIQRAEVIVLTHRLSRKRVFGTGSNLSRDSVIVRLEDRDGRVGWGETYLVPGVVEAGRAMAAGVVGHDPERAATDLAGAAGLHRWALGAVSMAVDDLRARRRDVPVAALYGEPLRGRVRAYASSRGYVEGMSSQAAWLEEAGAVWDDGFRAMKLRIGRDDPAAELDAIEGLVAAAPAMVWMADGNGAWGFDDSLRVGRRLAGLGFRWFEEPMPTNDYAAYAALAGELSIPLAGGEILESAEAAEPLLRGGCFDLVQPDVSICGGIGGALEIAARAAAAGRFTIPHACSGVIALAATLQLLAVLPVAPDAPPWAEPVLEHDVGENPIRTDLLAEPVRPADGWLAIPDGPGLGIEVDERSLRRLAA